jgi:peptidoglycan/LPS O-acetylase OafA/YrhL
MANSRPVATGGEAQIDRVSDATTGHHRIEFIDAIRGVASLLVVIGHGLEAWYPSFATWSLHWVNPGRVGIVAFFVVSGYVVGLTLTKQSPYVFSVRRFWRLYPIYWLSTLTYIAVAYTTGTPTPEFSAFVIVTNLLMVQGFIGAPSYLGVAWTLGIELAFYAQSVLFKMARALYWSVLLGFFWFAVFGGLALLNWTQGKQFSAVVPLMMFTASLGYALFLWDTRRSVFAGAYLAVAAIGVPLVGYVLALNQDTSPEGVWPASGFNLSYLAGLALFGAFYAARSISFSPRLLWLGAISYVLYLLHTIVIEALDRVDLPRPLLVLAATAGALVLADLLHRWVEQPSTDVGRRLTASPRR